MAHSAHLVRICTATDRDQKRWRVRKFKTPWEGDKLCRVPIEEEAEKKSGGGGGGDGVDAFVGDADVRKRKLKMRGKKARRAKRRGREEKGQRVEFVFQKSLLILVATWFLGWRAKVLHIQKSMHDVMQHTQKRERASYTK